MEINGFSIENLDVFRLRAIVNIISSPHGGGAELLVREMHRELVGRGIKAYAVYMDGTIINPIKNELIIGLHPRSPLNIFRLRKLLKQFAKNASGELVVHVHLTWPLYYVTLSTLGLKNIKLIFTEHSTSNKRRKIPLFWLVERLFYRKYHRIICISEGVKTSLSNWVGFEISRRLITIYNGARIYSYVERPSLDGRLCKLISIGSLTTRKNFLPVVKAIVHLREEVESYTILGEGRERKRLEQVVDREGLGNKVRLLGWMDDIEAHLRMADIQIVPSLWEGFGLVAVEGMSTGLPQVASNVPGLREVLDKSTPSVAFVGRPESVEEWVFVIRKMIANIRLQGVDRLAGFSRLQAEKFTFNEMVESYLEIYRRV